MLGALVAAGMYRLLKAMGYESANPGQDDDGLDTYRVVHAPRRPVRPAEYRPPRPPRPRRPTSFNFTGDNYYNNYLHELTSPQPTMKGPPMRF